MMIKDIESTKSGLNKLFTLMGIERVICVDDEYKQFSDETINDVIGFCKTLDKEKVLELSSEIPGVETVLFSEDEDIWVKQIRKIWRQADENKRAQLYHSFRGAYDPRSLDDIKAAGTLRNTFAESSVVEFLEVSYTQWRKQEEEFLKKENSSKTLFLFDQDLSGEEGGTPDEGIKIINKVLSTARGVICGLLSHTFSSEDEVTQWEKFSNQHQIDRDCFLLISKERLRGDKYEFLRSLRLTVLNKHCKKLKNRVSKLISETFEESRKEIDELDIYDFEHIVFRTSHYEGIWEPDTLFRLHGLFQRDAARRKAKNDLALNKLAAEIRSITGMSEGFPVSHQGNSWKIQRRELYEEGKHINILHMPIELGDIFQKTSGNRNFILLAQPCDLMVRSDGKRRHTVYEAVLAEIEKPSNDQAKHPAIEHGNNYKLLYFDEITGDEYYVNFTKTHSIKLCILDLCVYHKDGSAKISYGQTCPETVIPSWKNHFSKINRDFEKVIKRYKELHGKGIKKDILNMILPKSSNEKKTLFKAKIQLSKKEESLSYDCKRIRRLCQSRAGEMLMKYANYISRMAFEHDFGRRFED